VRTLVSALGTARGRIAGAPQTSSAHQGPVPAAGRDRATDTALTPGLGGLPARCGSNRSTPETGNRRRRAWSGSTSTPPGPGPCRATTGTRSVPGRRVSGSCRGSGGCRRRTDLLSPATKWPGFRVSVLPGIGVDPRILSTMRQGTGRLRNVAPGQSRRAVPASGVRAGEDGARFVRLRFTGVL
jgi:hypothetical protein